MLADAHPLAAPIASGAVHRNQTAPEAAGATVPTLAEPPGRAGVRHLEVGIVSAPVMARVSVRTGVVSVLVTVVVVARVGVGPRAIGVGIVPRPVTVVVGRGVVRHLAVGSVSGLVTEKVELGAGIVPEAASVTTRVAVGTAIVSALVTEVVVAVVVVVSAVVARVGVGPRAIGAGIVQRPVTVVVGRAEVSQLAAGSAPEQVTAKVAVGAGNISAPESAVA